jgi:acetyl esterase/lipase
MSDARIGIRKDVVMDTTATGPLCCDLYLPEQSGDGPRPAVVLVFGGGWRSGERSQQKVYGIKLAQAGFVCLATDYRPSTAARWPAQLDDVQCAIRWLRGHSEEFDADPERIAVSGNSSGGHLALMAAAESARGGEPLSAVCAFYPPTRLVGLDEESRDDTVRSLMGEGAAQEDYEKASPLLLAARPFPPVLLMTGGDDRRVPVSHTYDFYDAMLAAGNTVDLHVFSGQGHAFDAELPFAKLCATLMADFFRRYV